MYAYLQSVFWFHKDGVIATKLRIGEEEETHTGILHTDIRILHIQLSVYWTYIIYLHKATEIKLYVSGHRPHQF